MIRAFATLTFALLAPAAFGQDALQGELAPDPGMDAPTCGRFETLDSAGQIGMLTAIQPLGDEIDPSDADAARQWAAEVSRACGGRADRPLADAAREALGG
jgi:hypothetical protein